METLYKEELKNNTVKISKESRNIYLSLVETLKDVILTPFSSLTGYRTVLLQYKMTSSFGGIMERDLTVESQ